MHQHLAQGNQAALAQYSGAQYLAVRLPRCLGRIQPPCVADAVGGRRASRQAEASDAQPRAVGDGFLKVLARVSSTTLVLLRRNRYSLRTEHVHKVVSLRLYPERFDVVAENARIASHARSFERSPTFYDRRYNVSLIESKSDVLRNRPLLGAARSPEKAAGHLAAPQERRPSSYPGEPVLVATEFAFESGKPSSKHVVNVLARLKVGNRAEVSVNQTTTVPESAVPCGVGEGHGVGSTTRPSAAYNRWARLRTDDGVRRRIASVFQTAVELSLGEQRTGRLENVVGLGQLFVLSFELLEEIALADGQTLTGASINFLKVELSAVCPSSFHEPSPVSSSITKKMSLKPATDTFGKVYLTAAHSEGKSPR